MEESDEDSEDAPTIKIRKEEYYSATKFTSYRHQWLSGFFKYLKSPSAGYKKLENRLQHVGQVEKLLETLDPNGKDITILGEEFGDIVWNKWVSPHLSEGTKAPGTLASYLTSLEKFFVFVTSDKYKRKEMPPLHGNDFDVFKGTINALKGWRATIDNETQDVQHWTHLRECDTLLKETDINLLSQSKPYIDGIKAITQAKAGKRLSIQQFTNARDLLLVKLALLVASRPAPLENALLEDYQKAQEKDGNRVMLIPKHKRSREGPAPLGMDKELQDLMEVYVNKIRPHFVAKDVKHLFVKSDGQSFNRNTIGKRFSAFFEKSGVRTDRRVSQTAVRKFVTTAARRHAPEEMSNIQRVLCHSERSSRNSYLRLDLTETASHAMNIIKKVTSSETETKTKKETLAEELPEKQIKKGGEESDQSADVDLPGPSQLASEDDKTSTNVIPPTVSPGKVSSLTEKQKEAIREIFSSAIERGEKQQMKAVRNKMSTTLILRKMTTSISKVKQVTNFVNYLVSKRPFEVEGLPTQAIEVEEWLDDQSSSLKSDQRMHWDQRDTQAMEREFRRFRKCPPKQQLRQMFTVNARLAAICKKEGFSRCYEEVKSIMRKKNK